MRKNRLLIPVVILLCVLGIGTVFWATTQNQTTPVTVENKQANSPEQSNQSSGSDQQDQTKKQVAVSKKEESPKDRDSTTSTESNRTEQPTAQTEAEPEVGRFLPATNQQIESTAAGNLTPVPVPPAPGNSSDEQSDDAQQPAVPVPPIVSQDPTEPTPEEPEKPLSVPQIEQAEIEAGELYAGRAATKRLHIKTKYVPSGTTVYAVLINAAGEEVRTQEVNLNHNEALLDLQFSETLSAGEYTVLVKVDGLEKKLSCLVKEIEHPKLETVILDRTHHMQGDKVEVKVSGTTKHIADGTEVKITVTDTAGASLPTPINVTVAVSANAFEAVVVLPEDMSEGEYRILTETMGLVKEHRYLIDHRIEPQIRLLAVDSDTVLDNQRIIKVKADTADIKDGTQAQIDLMKADTVLMTAQEQVKADTLESKFLVEDTLEDGEYKIVLRVEGLTQETSFQIINPRPPVEPKLIEVKADKEEGIELTEDEISITVTTEGIMNMAEISAELQRADGSAVEPKVESKKQLYDQSAALNLRLPDSLTEGDYRIRVTVAEQQLEAILPYKLVHKMVPALESLSLDQTEHTEESETTVTATVQTKDIEDNEMILLELVDEQGTSLPARVTAEAVVQNHRAEAAIQIPASVPFGDYRIRASYRTLISEQAYRILYLPKPEILEVKANKYAVSYGYSDQIQIVLKLKDIPTESEMKVILRNEAGLPVEGYEEQIVKTLENAWEHTYALDPLAVGKYFIHVELVGNEAVATDIDLTVSDADAGWKTLLDYSQKNDQLYWFDELNRAYAYTDPNSPFDPKKPTMIFIHGWQENGVSKNGAQDFDFLLTYDGQNGKQEVRVNSAKAWIDAGYNVGVYNWVQIADEPGEGWLGIPYSAEAKIWTTNYQYYKRPMRYRLNNGSFINETEKTAAELFVEKYLDAMKGYQGDFITFGGHSLGNQMVLRATALIMERVNQNQVDRALVPDQLTLFDPYYAGNTDRFAIYKTQSKTTTAKAGAAIAADLAKQNIVIDMYKSSNLTTSSLAGDVNGALENVAAYNRIYPDMYGFSQQAEKHSTAYQFYYWAKLSGNDFYIKHPAEIASLMGNYFRIEQSEGKDTLDPSDDKGVFKKSGSYVPVKDIILKDESDQVLARTAPEDHEILTVATGTYTRVKATVTPSNATAQVVVIEKVGGDMDTVQLAYDGYIKGIQPGTTILKAIVVTRDAAGNKTGTIEKYFSVEVR